MLDLFKPISIKAKTHKPIISNVFGLLYDKPYRPFVIFFDKEENCYYYLRARGTVGVTNDGKPFVLKPNKYEVFIHQIEHPEEELFQIDSYVDCSQIFKMNKEELESLVDVNSDYYLSTSKLTNIQINIVLENIKKSLMERPPYLSIIEVRINENKDDKYKTDFECLYLNKELYNKEFKVLNKPSNIQYVIDNKDILLENSKLNNAYSFSLMFLNEYFPNKVQDFKNIQWLEPKKGGQKC